MLIREPWGERGVQSSCPIQSSVSQLQFTISANLIVVSVVWIMVNFYTPLILHCNLVDLPQWAERPPNSPYLDALFGPGSWIAMFWRCSGWHLFPLCFCFQILKSHCSSWFCTVTTAPATGTSPSAQSHRRRCLQGARDGNFPRCLSAWEIIS